MVSFDVSVVIPAHNAETRLSDALEGLGAQTCPPAEVIVVDDGSHDETAALAAGWRFPWGRAPTVIRHPEALGTAAARNHGALCARSEWVAFCDDDDVWHPARLEHLARASERHPASDAIGSGAVGFALETELSQVQASGRGAMATLVVSDARVGTLVDALGELAAGEERLVRPEEFYYDGVFVTALVAFRRRAYFVAGGTPTILPIAEDYVAHASASFLTNLIKVELPLVFYRIRPHSQADDELRVAWDLLLGMLAVRGGPLRSREPNNSLFRHLVLAQAREKEPWRVPLGFALLGGLSGLDLWMLTKARVRTRLRQGRVVEAP